MVVLDSIVVLLAFILNPIAKRKRRQQAEEDAGVMTDSTPAALLTPARSLNNGEVERGSAQGRIDRAKPDAMGVEEPPGEPAGVGLVVSREEQMS